MTRAGVALRATVVAAVAALALTGCGNAVEGLAEGAVERAIENEIGESADVSINEDSFTVDTEEGSITAGAGSVPEDFPSDVPLPQGEVSFAQRLETADGLGWSVVITVSGDPGTVAEQVRSDMEGSGFTVDEATEFSGTDGSGGTILGEKGDLTALVLVAGEGDETVVTYTVNESAGS
jgi:hypothetical protein